MMEKILVIPVFWCQLLSARHNRTSGSESPPIQVAEIALAALA